MSAAGYTAPPIYIIADECMPENETDPHTIVGLGNGSDNVGAPGFLIFSKTRVPSESFYEWYIDHVLIPFIFKIRTALGPDYDNATAWNTIDGELLQLKPMSSKNNTDKFREINLINGKSPSSCTELFQACDDLMFKVAKAAVKTIGDEDIIDASLEKNLNVAFQLHRTKYRTPTTAAPQEVSSKRSKVKPNMMSSVHVHSAIRGILRIQLGLQRNWRSETIRMCFKNVGMCPLDVKLMISRCKTKITEEQLEYIMERFPELVTLYQLRGEVTDEDFRRLGFDVIQEEASKDDLVLCRRRAVIFSNDGYLLREAEKEKEKEAAIARLETGKRARQEEKEKAAIENERKKQKKIEDNQFKIRQAEQAVNGVLVLKIPKK